MTAAERAKLARILGMLGSEHAGERAAAALQAEAFRKRHGMTWEEMLALKQVEVVVSLVPDPVMAAQQTQWAAEDAARKARWAGTPTPPKPRPVRKPPKAYPFVPPHKRPTIQKPTPQKTTDRWHREDIPMHLFTLVVLIGTPALLHVLGFMPPHWGLPR